MQIRYPDSFLKLLLIGFGFAIIPLLWAFINTNIEYGELAKQSELTISQAVKTTRLSRALQEHSRLMERSARQYFVLKDSILFKNYHQAYLAFNESINQLIKIQKNIALKKKLQTIEKDVVELHYSISKQKDTSDENLDFLNQFDQLTANINQVILKNNAAIDEAASQFTKKAKIKQRKLFLQSLILIPFALMVAGVITFLLAKPIRRMDSAIRDLGEGHYEKTISIDGPGDLRILGSRLDWLRKELKDVNAQKQQFLRHVSHELKTPLTAIREATELLHDGIGGSLSRQQNEIIQIMRDNSIRLQKMIENLLNYTKVDSSKAKTKLLPIDLNNVIHNVLKAHALTVKNKHLKINVQSNIDENIISNEEKLSIILDNLITNAINYSPESSQLNIVTNAEPEWFVIDVEDSGPGLAKEDAEKIFEPFFRGNTVHNGLISGSGLGLTIVKDIVETLDGEINLIPSKSGAHFCVRLPRNIDNMEF
jgi:two-component system, NtrC family, sensor histidine kinase GlrK